MDKALCNIIYGAVVRCRKLLEQDFGLQLEGTYGVHADGVEPGMVRFSCGLEDASDIMADLEQAFAAIA